MRQNSFQLLFHWQNPRLVGFLSILAGMVGGLTGIFEYTSGLSLQGLVNLLSAGVLLVSGIFAISKQRFRVPANILVIVGSAALIVSSISGSLEKTSVAWFGLVPIIAIYIYGRYLGLVITCGFALYLLGFGWLSQETQLLSRVYSWPALRQAGLALLMYTVVAYYFDREIKNAETVLLNSNSELQKATSDLQQELTARTKIEAQLSGTYNDLDRRNLELQHTRSAILNVLEDIQLEKAKSEQLSERLLLAASSAKIGIYEWDTINDRLFWDKEMYELYGLPQTVQVVSIQDWVKLLTPENGLLVKSWFDRLAQGKSTEEMTLKLNIPGQGARYFKLTAFLKAGPVNQRVVGVNWDITKEQEANLQIQQFMDTLREKNIHLEEEKTKIEALLACMPEAIILTDKQGIISLVNQSVSRVLGKKPHDLVGKPIVDSFQLFNEKSELIPAKERPAAIAMRTGKKVTVNVGDAFYIEKEGSKIPVTVEAVPYVFHDHIAGIIDIIRDVTQEKAIDRAKTEFVSLASHQLRTPLSAIRWYAEMLLAGDAGSLTEEQTQFIGGIYEGNKRMIELVSALLNVSRIELGTFVIEPQIMEVEKELNNVLDDLRPEIVKNHTQIAVKLDTGLKQYYADSKLFRIILQNLISNAVKYSPKKGKVSVCFEKSATEVLLSVSDAGLGIPTAQQKRIFEKLFRADNAAALNVEGNGLGLYIVKAVVEGAGGKVWFESVENKGSVFYVSLPLEGMKKRQGSKILV